MVWLSRGALSRWPTSLRRRSIYLSTTAAPSTPATPATPATPVTQDGREKLSFHGKPLPAHIASFTSPRGRALFAEAMRCGGLKAYFQLAANFETQSEPAFCGVGTLTMSLNALGIDPGRRWKGVWRWYADSMIECCVKLEKIEKEGMSFEEFSRLARCNGAVVDEHRAEALSLEEFRRVVQEVCVCAPGCEDDETHDHSKLSTALVCSYSRAVLGQTGDGHFSPIAAYAPESDECLILDVARFKYPPHWVKISQLWEAMLLVNPWNEKSRGYFTLSRFPAPKEDHDRCPEKLRYWAINKLLDPAGQIVLPANKTACSTCVGSDI